MFENSETCDLDTGGATIRFRHSGEGCNYITTGEISEKRKHPALKLGTKLDPRTGKTKQRRL